MRILAATAAILLFGVIALVPSFRSDAEIGGCATGGPMNGSLSAPEGLTGSRGGGPMEVELSWTDTSDDEACFVVERRYDDNSYEVIAVLPVDYTAYSDPFKSGHDIVRYRVRAANPAGYSMPSNEVMLDVPAVETVPPFEPTGTPASNLRGDMDCNQEVDAIDALPIIAGVAGFLWPHRPNNCVLDPYPGYPASGGLGRSDLDCDNDTDISDALVVLRHESGFGSGSPICPELG